MEYVIYNGAKAQEVAKLLGVEVLSPETFGDPKFQSMINTLVYFHQILKQDGMTEEKEVELFILSEPRFNAFAITLGFHCIGVNSGVFLTAHNLMRRASLSAKCFPWLPSPAADADAALPVVGDDIIEGLSTPIDTESIDDVRLHLARYGAHQIVLWILRHEYGHIRYGHTSYLKDRYGLVYVEEAAATILPDDLNGIDFQTLEMDADSFATTNMIRHALKLNSESNNPVTEQWKNNFLEMKYGPGTSFAFIAITLMYLMMRCFSVSADDDEATHPSWPYRQNGMLSTTIQILESLYGGPTDKWRTFVSMAAAHAEHCFAAITDREADSTDFDDMVSNVYSQKTGQLMRNWAKMRPLLEPWVQSGTLPPIQQVDG